MKPFIGNYQVTRPYGVYDPAYSNYPGSKHPGTDFGVPANTQLVAVTDAVVVATFDRDPNLKTGRGKEVRIAVGNQEFRYCHMNRIDVSPGQVLEAGQGIGLSGFTGYVLDAAGNVGTPAGAHLHFEMLINGAYVDYEQNKGKIEEGGDMPITEGQQDKALKMGLQREPRPDELANPEWRKNPGLLIDTLWGNGGSAIYYLSQRPIFTRGDIDNLFKDLGIEPTEADYEAIKLSPKDFAYYLQTQIKNRVPSVTNRQGAIDYIVKNLK